MTPTDNGDLLMIKIFTQFVSDFAKASKRERAHLYLQFVSSQAFYFSLLSEEQIIRLSEAINKFVSDFDSALPWRKSKVVISALSNFIL